MGGDPFSSDYYWQAYQDLLLALKKRGLEAYFVTDNNSYHGDGLFDTAYTTDHKTSISKLQVVHDVQVDMVFDRGGFIGRDVKTINPAQLLKTGNNKIEMYRHFAAFQPLSAVCASRDEVVAAFERISGDKIVVKQPEGCGGKEVYIGDKADVLSQLPDVYPVLVQEFMDTSAGVPGYVKGVHDVRLSVCGGKIVGYYIRSAKAGSYHSNVSQGGTMMFYDVSHVPRDLRRTVQSIDAHFRRMPRYYAIDFMYTPKGWKLVELNPYLALLPETDGPEARKTSKALTDYLVAETGKAARRKQAHDERLAPAK
jgi:glutathione synthase/RimK-type ligase-like ATP-grasp enzyme